MNKFLIFYFPNTLAVRKATVAIPKRVPKNTITCLYATPRISLIILPAKEKIIAIGVNITFMKKFNILLDVSISFLIHYKADKFSRLSDIINLSYRGSERLKTSLSLLVYLPLRCLRVLAATDFSSFRGRFFFNNLEASLPILLLVLAIFLLLLG